MAAVKREKRNVLNALRESAEHRDPNLTYQPRICSGSERIARRRSGQCETNEGITDRLAREAQRLMEQRMKKLLDIEQEISKGTERLAKEKEELRLKFLERQKVLQDKADKKVASRQARYLEEERRWFKPSIGKAQEILQKRRPEHAKENIEQRVERLSQQEMQRIEKDRARRAEEYYSKFTFEPEINRMSQVLGRKATTDELVHNFRGDMARIKAIEEAEARHRAECTFSPNLVTRPKTMSQENPRESGPTLMGWKEEEGEEATSIGKGGGGLVVQQHVPPSRPTLVLNLKDPQEMTRQLEQYRREKEDYIRRTKAEKEIRELQQCTFQPSTNKRRPRAKGPVVVRGLGKFLEQREHALRLQKEKEERERQVFRLASSGGGPRGKTTVCQPFRLSEKNKAREERTRLEMEEDFLSRCTFKPTTVSSLQRQAIKKLIEESFTHTD